MGPPLPTQEDTVTLSHSLCHTEASSSATLQLLDDRRWEPPVNPAPRAQVKGEDPAFWSHRQVARG